MALARCGGATRRRMNSPHVTSTGLTASTRVRWFWQHSNSWSLRSVSNGSTEGIVAPLSTAGRRCSRDPGRAPKSALRASSVEVATTRLGRTNQCRRPRQPPLEWRRSQVPDARWRASRGTRNSSRSADRPRGDIARGAARRARHGRRSPASGHTDARRTTDGHLQRDIAEATGLFSRLDRRNTSTVLIGSVKSNYLVELFVAKLFGCVPFREVSAAQPSSRPPIYMQYRGTDRRPPSCMAGDNPPTGRRALEEPGVYYVDGNEVWTKAPSLDTGVAITAYDPVQEKFQLAAFGFRGRTTEALGSRLRDRSTELWPTEEDAMGPGKPRVR
jgi:hypothetical protein